MNQPSRKAKPNTMKSKPYFIKNSRNTIKKGGNRCLDELNQKLQKPKQCYYRS